MKKSNSNLTFFSVKNGENTTQRFNLIDVKANLTYRRNFSSKNNEDITIEEVVCHGTAKDVQRFIWNNPHSPSAVIDAIMYASSLDKLSPTSQRLEILLNYLKQAHKLDKNQVIDLGNSYSINFAKHIQEDKSYAPHQEEQANPMQNADEENSNQQSTSPRFK